MPNILMAFNNASSLINDGIMLLHYHGHLLVSTVRATCTSHGIYDITYRLPILIKWYYIKLILKMTISFKHNVTNMTIKNQHKIDNNKLQSCLHKKKGKN